VTSDYGKTWSKPVQIGQDPPNQRYEPWINYSPTGVLDVAYKTEYGASCQPIAGCSGGNYDFWAAVSRDGGSSFSPPIRISHAVSPAEPSGGDDFSYVALDNNYLYASWADMRKSPNSSAAGDRTLYFARVRLIDTRPATRGLLTCRRTIKTRRRNKHPRTPATPLSCPARPVRETLKGSSTATRATIGFDADKPFIQRKSRPTG
jgi:hypothetical protein